jgi:CRISPR-associated protein Cas2
MWARTTEMVRTGRAIMLYSARNEQHLDFLVHGHHWTPVNIDGLTLMLRPDVAEARERAGPTSATTVPRSGWSKAARRRAHN